MATPQWTGRQSLAQPTVNPSAAIAGASRAFSGISDYLQKHQQNADLAAYRDNQAQIQNDQFQQNIGIEKDKLEWNKGAGDRAVKAAIAEEQRRRAQKAGVADMFMSQAEADTARQLEQFTQFSPETVQALETAGHGNNIGQLLDNAKQQHPELFLDRGQTMSNVEKAMMLKGYTPEEYGDASALFRKQNNMSGVDAGTVEFMRDLALAGVKNGKGSKSSSSGNANDSNFARNVAAIEDEKSFREGSKGWFEGWFGDNKAYKSDVIRISEHAMNNFGVRPMYIAQAIKADMQGGKTEYDLKKIAQDPSSESYKSIVASARLMQMQNDAGSANPGGSTSSGASVEQALLAGAGYQPITRQQRERAVLEMAKSLYPQNVTKSNAEVSNNQQASMINDVLKSSAQPDNTNLEEVLSKPYRDTSKGSRGTVTANKRYNSKLRADKQQAEREMFLQYSPSSPIVTDEQKQVIEDEIASGTSDENAKRLRLQELIEQSRRRINNRQQ